MRQGSLFARLRGNEGRSLARALILLVLVSLFASGLNAGAALAGDATLCIADDAGGKAPAPDHDPGPDCCILGPSPLGMALLSDGPAAAPLAPAVLVHAWPDTGSAIPRASTRWATARGPPLEA